MDARVEDVLLEARRRFGQGQVLRTDRIQFTPGSGGDPKPEHADAQSQSQQSQQLSAHLLADRPVAHESDSSRASRPCGPYRRCGSNLLRGAIVMLNLPHFHPLSDGWLRGPPEQDHDGSWGQVCWRPRLAGDAAANFSSASVSPSTMADYRQCRFHGLCRTPRGARASGHSPAPASRRRCVRKTVAMRSMGRSAKQRRYP